MKDTGLMTETVMDAMICNTLISTVKGDSAEKGYQVSGGDTYAWITDYWGRHYSLSRKLGEILRVIQLGHVFLFVTEDPEHSFYCAVRQTAEEFHTSYSCIWSKMTREIGLSGEQAKALFMDSMFSVGEERRFDDLLAYILTALTRKDDPQEVVDAYLHC